jgi:hypothetical protein
MRRENPGCCGNHAQWPKRQAGSLSYIALRSVERSRWTHFWDALPIIERDRPRSPCRDHLENLVDFGFGIVEVRAETNVVAALPVLARGTDDIRGGKAFE